VRVNVRCADGPFIGQTVTVPFPRTNWLDEEEIGQLVWIVYGPDKHCYQVVSNGYLRDYRLVYRYTF
jgi:hypothetical protein